MLIPYDQLQKKLGINAIGVMHIGANVGEEREAYRNGGVKKAHWIEANPELMPELLKNISTYNGHTAECLCLGDRSADVMLHISNNAAQSSSVMDLGYHKTAHPEVHYIKDIPVSMVRYDEHFLGSDILDGLDFLNIDVQGYELMVLRGIGDMLRQFKWIYLEVNKKELYVGCPMIEDLDLYLLSFGFIRRATEWAGNTGWGDAIWIREK